jgi:acetyltransferase-like isoleucine patch superfamily enzyme
MLRNAQCSQHKPRIFGPILIKNQGKLSIGSGVRINSHKWANVIGGDQRSSIVVLPGGEMHIGDNVGFSNSAFFCTTRIQIGKNVMIGGSCKIWDTDFHSLDSTVRATDPNGGYKSAPIIIHDNAFIGANSIILKGVTIGKNAIVGAGSVVTKSIPDNEIWAGNPAKFIRTCS